MSDISPAASAPVTGGPLRSIPALINSMRSEFARVLPATITPDRLARVALTEIHSRKELEQCSPESLLGALMSCAQLGLEPGVLNEVYLVPMGRQVKFIIGYRGLIKLARQSGEVLSVSAHEVYTGDEFRWQYGTDEFLLHRPMLDGDRGRLKLFYAVARLTRGQAIFDVLSLKDVEEARAQSRSPKGGPWETHYEAMGRKTAIRRLAKTMPQGAEFATGLAVDETVRTVARPEDVTPLVIPPDTPMDGEDPV